MRLIYQHNLTKDGTYRLPEKEQAKDGKISSNSIIGRETPIVDGKSGADALAIALNIQKIIKKDFF